MGNSKTEIELTIALVTGMIPMIILCLAMWGYTISSSLKSYWSWRRDLRRDAKFNARINKRASIFGKSNINRAPSSIREERLTLNQKVPGSNPGGLTTRGNDLRRRITWHLAERTAIVCDEASVLPIKYQWRQLPRPKEEIDTSNPDIGYTRFRKFNDTDDQFELLWDGTAVERFVSQVDLKRFIIQLSYTFRKGELIPSEILADANLVYEEELWIDFWGTNYFKNSKIIECPRELWRPATRNIRFIESSRLGHVSPKKPTRHVPVTNITAKVDRWKWAKPVEIIDEKCFYTFRAGGFYEKDQKPLNETCEEKENTV